jgi:NAD(P)-dependent dehydrogenase (short-subunit alcohol dehydrogenase family)
MRELKGRVAVVTGAANGIGLAICERLAAAGMNLVMADINETALAEAAEQLSRSAAVETLPVVVDVSKWDSVENLASLAFERFGAVHVLCNNAGVVSPKMPVWELSLADWDWLLGIDLWGVIHGVKAFLPRMLDDGQPGHIVNTASIAGVLPQPYNGSYTVAKYGVVALSESLILGLRDRGAPVGVSALCPGPVSTSLRSSSASMRPDGAAGFNMSQNPDAMTSEEVAEVVFEAIINDRFWVFPQSHYRDKVAARSRGIIETDEVLWSPDAWSLRSKA